MPLLVRGPDPAAGAVPKVRPGSTTNKLALNNDYLPTFTDLACPPSNPCDAQVTQKWSYVPDGRSLRPVLEGNATSWRAPYCWRPTRVPGHLELPPPLASEQ
jgi:hypothetical protein